MIDNRQALIDQKERVDSDLCELKKHLADRSLMARLNPAEHDRLKRQAILMCQLSALLGARIVSAPDMSVIEELERARSAGL